MNRTQEKARYRLVQSTERERILEQSALLAEKLTKKEQAVAGCILDMIQSGRIGLGYQFGIKRFNSMFVKWNDGKATAKASELPAVKDVANACKSLYRDCKQYGFFPIVRMNSDGAVIIDCIRWTDDFYAERKKTDAERPQKTEQVVIEYEDLTAMLEKSDTETLTELMDDIRRILSERITLHKKTA